MSKHRFFIIITVCIVVLVALVIVNSAQNNNRTNKNNTQTEELFMNVQRIPTRPQGGIDLDSIEIRTAREEVRKIEPHLPYRKTYTLSTGEEIVVGIPSVNLLDNEWTLIVYSDLDFLAKEGTEEYEANRQVFLRANDEISSWIIQTGADPGKIFLQWDDKISIQNRAQQWLQQP